ncbi:hypothetical protein JAAARDRAFT_126367 [Jaapia argillacea MUCL 33604]|uniref:Hydrophobin n=1 Tax=Jaapia argillacea MUCL 33604 TaxID=933084 RepID=A0A067QAA6_9AGAM|nr:hypothetical protein JAAARDRAFT_126367 [Jaapia argillacea MUCL 33604]
MFTKTFAVLSLISLVAATPTPQGSSNCNTGSIQCCNSVQSASTKGLAARLGLSDTILQGVTGLVGIDCSPVTLVGTSTCTQQPVCCSDNAHGGLISIGCIPISL